MGRTPEEQSAFDETRDLLRLSWLLAFSLSLMALAFFSRLPPPLTVVLSIPLPLALVSLSSQRVFRLQAEWLLRGTTDPAQPDARPSRALPGPPGLNAVPAPPPGGADPAGSRGDKCPPGSRPLGAAAGQPWDQTEVR